MNRSMIVEPEELRHTEPAVIFDCRFSLADPELGQIQYSQGHIPGAYFLDLNRDLAGPVAEHGGRHPLPEPDDFVELLARHGVGPDSRVVAYDDSRLAGAARLWWMMRSLGFREPKLLSGGYQAFLAAGGEPECEPPAKPVARESSPASFAGCCDIEALRILQAEGALLVDSREERRFQGLEEPIDPVAGHIPGAVNRPWLGVTDADGRVRGIAALQSHWGDALEEDKLVVYCGSGVTACVNLFSLALLGRDDAVLYAGSWSDWCSYL